MIDPRLARRMVAAELQSRDTERLDLVSALRGYVAQANIVHRMKGESCASSAK